jgi:methylmalonyl-CoA mutase
MHPRKNNTTIFFCNLDPIGQLAKEGNWFTTSEKSNFDTLNILSQTISTVSLGINGALYQNAGATIVQQIAYSLVTRMSILIELSRSINPSF